jgi:hypothetical protein
VTTALLRWAVAKPTMPMATVRSPTITPTGQAGPASGSSALEHSDPRGARVPRLDQTTTLDSVVSAPASQVCPDARQRGRSDTRLGSIAMTLATATPTTRGQNHRDRRRVLRRRRAEQARLDRHAHLEEHARLRHPGQPGRPVPTDRRQDPHRWLPVCLAGRRRSHLRPGRLRRAGRSRR